MPSISRLFLVMGLSIVLLLLEATMAPTIAQGNASPIIRVAVYENSPKLFTNQHKQMDGIYADLLKHIAAKEGWTLRPISCDIATCIAGLKTGLVDIVPGLTKLDVNPHQYQFHPLPALQDWVILYAPPGHTAKNIFDIRQKRIATYLDRTLHMALTAQLNERHINAHLLPSTSPTQALQRITQNEVDYAAVNYINNQLISNNHILLPSTTISAPIEEFYVSFHDSQHERLTTINHYLGRWRQEPNSFYQQTLQKWIPSPTPPVNTLYFWGGIVFLILLVGIGLSFIKHLLAKIGHQRRHIAHSERRLNVILDSVDAHIFIKDSRLRYVYANRSMCNFFSTTPDGILGKTDAELGIHVRTAEEIRRNDLLVLRNHERRTFEEHYYDASNKVATTFLSVRLPLQDDDSANDDTICGISTDITEYKATREANHQLAFYDVLTNLPNRRLLMSRLKNKMGTLKEEHHIMALLLIDLDNFKHINDARGHAVGDALLKRVATRLQRLLSDQHLIARLGGDEFVVVLPDLGSDSTTAEREALNTAERIRSELEKPFSINASSYLNSASIGVSFLTANSNSVEDAMREADTAMYRAKEQGRNRVVCFAENMKKEVEERLSLERDLSFAIGTNQLQAYLQPQHNRNREIIGVELLVRWFHPTRGAISPSVFIPIAEETQLISKLGDWVLEQACQLLLLYRAQQFTISINISPSQFLEPDFIQRVQQILQRYRVDTDRLIFEVTEGMLMHDWHQTISIMNELVSLGIRFAIDDFGTGYSNLSAIKRLPLYELKIDHSLIQDIHTDDDSAAIVRAVLALGQQLRLHVVAEGVENLEQVIFLNKYECSAIQGHFFSQALSIEEWQAYIQKNFLL